MLVWQTIVTAIAVMLLGLGSAFAYWAHGAVNNRENPTGRALLLPMVITTVVCAIGVFLIDDPRVWHGLIGGVILELVIGVGGVKYLGRRK